MDNDIHGFDRFRRHEDRSFNRPSRTDYQHASLNHDRRWGQDGRRRDGGRQQKPAHVHTQYKTQRVKEHEMIFGIRAVMEALDAGRQIEKILIRRDNGSELSQTLMSKVKGTSVPVQFVPQEKLNQYTDKNHQGVIAFISPIEFQRIQDVLPAVFEAGRAPLLVVLDGVTDVRNFGAIARTCECAGVDALIVPMKGGAGINGDAVKTSAGALHHLTVCREESLSSCLRYLKDSGVQLVASTEKTASDYMQVDMSVPTAIIMGSEDVGIDEYLLDLCNVHARIPMYGSIESLNVSVAAGIMIYEAVKQRHMQA